MALLLGNGAMFHATGDHDQLAFTQYNGSVAKFHREFAVNHQEELVFVVVGVPIKDAVEFGQLDFLPIQGSNNSGGPMFRQLVKTGVQVDGLHVAQRLPQPTTG